MGTDFILWFVGAMAVIGALIAFGGWLAHRKRHEDRELDNRGRDDRDGPTHIVDP